MNKQGKMRKFWAGVLSVATLFCGGLAIGNLSDVDPIVADAAVIPEATRAENGLSFDSKAAYEVDSALTTLPKTVEAYVRINSASRHYSVISSFQKTWKTTENSMSIEVNADGTPRLYYWLGKEVNILFDAKLLPTDGKTWAHLSITNDGTTASCYIDGVLKDTATVDGKGNALTAHNFNNPSTDNFRIGWDPSNDTVRVFKGNIKGIECYSDARTADEIAADYARLQTAAPTGDNLLCAYDFTRKDRAYLQDLSANNYDIDFTGDDDNADIDGVSFSNPEEFYEVTKMYSALPNTIEAEIFLPKTYAARAGCIFGNWSSDSVPAWGLEVNAGGVPRFRYNYANGTVYNYTFNTDVRTGDWAHLTITHDKASAKTTCYLDGVAVGTVAYTEYPENITQSFLIGGDHRSGNAQNFKGYIRSIALYSDVRSAEEVAFDAANGVDAESDNLLAYYKLPKSAAGADVEDLSGNGYDVDFHQTWITEKVAVKDYAYSFAVVGDTQCVNELNPQHMDTMYQWIVDNAESKKIAHVFGLGDITQSTSAETSAVEWDKAVEVIAKLDAAGIPYSLVRGNHDDTVLFNEHFNTETYKAQFAGFYEEDKIDNSWKTFTVGGTDYLLVTLDYGADDQELAWAGSVMDAFPNHKVIVTTHAYMYRDGTTLSIDDVCSPADSNDWSVDPYKVYNNGDQMWDKLISQHGNIFLVLSGHDPCEDVVTTQTKGVHGNTVTQILVDPQGMDAAIGTYPESLGMVCMLYFSEDGKSIEVEWYSTVKGQYYKDTNQYTIPVYDESVDAHTAEEYTFDNNAHWYACADCGVTYKKAAHEYGEWVVVQPTATEAGSRTKSCVCGHEIKEVLTAYDFGNAFGASIRLSEPNGIRFRLQISQSTKEAVFAEGSNLQLGMFLFPADKMDAANGDYASLAQKINFTFAEEDLYQLEDGYWYANGVMTNLYLQNITRTFIGVGYIYDGTTYTYSAFVEQNNARSMFDVAKAAYQKATTAAEKEIFAAYIEKAIYAAYGVVEVRENGVVSFQKGDSVWTSYEDMKKANPISLMLDTDEKLAAGVPTAFETTVLVNGTPVMIDLPIDYELSENLTMQDGKLIAEKAGKATIKATYETYTAEKEFTVWANIDGIFMDGARDGAYGEFTDTTLMDDGRWYNISAVKTEKGVFLYTQALFNSTVIGEPGTAIHATWNNSTNFEFKFNGGTQFYVNAAGQSYGVDSFIFNVEETNGKYLHTAEIFVSKDLIADWTENDLQLNYAWMSPEEQTAILDDMIDYQYLSSWGNNSTFHAYHRLGGISTGFNDMVDNLTVSKTGLKTVKAPLATMDGAVSAKEAELYGANEINVTTANATTKVQATVVDGDIYMVITVTHGAWSAYNATAWHKNDNFEMYIEGDHTVIMFLNGNPCVPAYFTDYGVQTTEANGKQVTVLELYKKGELNVDAYRIRINANGANFGWNDIMWGNEQTFGLISAEGVVRPATAFSAGGLKIDGVFDEAIYTSPVRHYSLSVNANGASVNVMAIKTEKGVVFATTITSTKEPNVSTNGSTNWYAYTNPEFRINAGSGYFLTGQNKGTSVGLLAYCKTVDNGNGTYTYTYEYFIDYDWLGIQASDTVKFSVGGWYETGWKWLFGGNATTMTHTATEYGVLETFEKMSNSEFYAQAAAFGSPNTNATTRARIAFSVKMMAGTKIVFTGDATVYSWAVNECENNSQKPSVDSGWLKGKTYQTTKDLYPVIVLKRVDGQAFTADERMALHTMFQVDGYKLSPVTADDEGAVTQEEVAAQFARFGNVYHNVSSGTTVATTRASIVFAFKVKLGTVVTYLGDDAYNWAVCEMTNNTGVSANLLSDSGWNNASGFKGTSTTTYKTLNDQIYLVISLKKTGSTTTFTQAELATLNALFKVEGEKVADSTIIERGDYATNSVAHRGYSTTAPENTLAAYRLAAQNGFSAVECDVEFTSDGVPVLLHDSTIDRTSNGTGNIAELTLEQVRAYDFGSWKSAAYANEKIPTFEEFIALCKELELHPYIEIKNTISEAYAKTLYDIVAAAEMLDNVTWISFSSVSLGLIRDLDNTARLGYVVSDVTSDTVTVAQGLKTEENEVFIDCYYSLDADDVSLCKNAGFALEVWTVDSVDTLLALDGYVSGVTSNWLVAGMYLG